MSGRSNLPLPDTCSSQAATDAPAATAKDPLGRFIRLGLAMLDAATAEPERCQLERELLALLPTVQARGAFALFEIRAPALRALIEDELAGTPQ